MAASKSRQSLRHRNNSNRDDLDPVLDHQAPLTREEAISRSKQLGRNSRKSLKPSLPMKHSLAESEVLEEHEIVVDSGDDRSKYRRSQNPIVDEKIEEYRAWVQQRVASRQRELQQARQRSQEQKEQRSESLKRLAAKTKMSRENTDQKATNDEMKSRKSKADQVSPQYFSIEQNKKSAPSPQSKRRTRKSPQKSQADPETVRQHKFEHYFGKRP